MRSTTRRLSIRKPSWVNEEARSLDELLAWEKRSESNTFAHIASVKRPENA